MQVEERRSLRDVDTAENRFAKSFLALASGVFDRMEGLARACSETRFWRRVLCDCEAMSRALAPYVRAPLWREVGALTHVPAGSTVLQRRRGYRALYRHYLRLRASACLPREPDSLEAALEVKDIAELYELWCYFRVVRAIGEALGRAPSAAGRFAVGDTHVGVPRDFTVAWPGGVACLYNPSFSRSASQARRSYSVPLRPDIALTVTRGPRRAVHLFDAKFKLRALQTWEEADERGERRGTFARADLYKMHAYRDAIVAARSVRVLYPGTEAVFFPAAPGALDGVGAVPLAPGRAEALGDVVGRLLGA